MRFVPRSRLLARAVWAAILLAAVSSAAVAVPADASIHPSFRVQITGQGQPMILIPGLASSGTTWNGTVAHFQHQYRCYVLTLAGFAGVPPMADPAAAPGLLVTVRRQLAAYIRAEHLDHPVIVGHSLGGSIALDLAAHDPQLAGPVVIVDSLPFFAGAWIQAPNLAAAQPIIAQMRAGMEHETHAQYLAYARAGMATNNLATRPSDQQRLIRWGLASDQGTVTEAMLELVSRDLRPELPKISSPVLVIGTWIGLGHGVTRAMSAAVFQEQYAGVRHLKFVMTDNARHFVMWDEPVWFYRQLTDFLNTASPAAGAVAPGAGRS